ncbi:hypothetical protein PHYBOEH_008368 [Phytophthora boehmeriae]|uniref:Sugar transporter SWEET1 n=1 Tax=Phytophthora boehmeriae TaxID=109152 RepID=A0A8T1W4N2_9STRA|nr:hypothetical protein PHYBOEH_008368 [Phytophthora boehmeriae]
MSAHEVAVIVAKVLTIIMASLMRFSLLPDFNRMRKKKSTGDMSVMPCVLLYTNCYTLCWYSFVIGDILPIFATSMLGVITGLTFAFFFYRWSDYKRDVVKAFIGSGIVTVVVAVYSILAILGKTGQSQHSIDTTLGYFTIATTIGLYGSPMATIARVLQTKTASSMPFTMGVINLGNSICWAVYSSLVGNWFILSPNIAGIVLGSTQLILTFIYPRKNPDGAWITPALIDECINERACSNAISSSVQHGDGAVDNNVVARSSSSFVSLQSPSPKDSITLSSPRLSSRIQK